MNAFARLKIFILIVFLWGLFTLPSQGLAEPSEPVPDRSSGISSDPVINPTNPQFQDPSPSNSTANRSDKAAQAAIEFGFPVFPIPSVGINGGYFISPRTLLMGEYTEGKLGWWFIHVHTMTAGLHLKHFVGNSFYLKGGIDYRRVNLDNPDIPVVGSMTPDIGRAETLGASFALGNQWQWQNFVLDLQWFGVTAPLSQLKTDYNTQGYNAGHVQDLDVIWDRVAKFWTVQVLRVSLGASF